MTLSDRVAELLWGFGMNDVLLVVRLEIVPDCFGIVVTPSVPSGVGLHNLLIQATTCQTINRTVPPGVVNARSDLSAEA